MSKSIFTLSVFALGIVAGIGIAAYLAPSTSPTISLGSGQWKMIYKHDENGKAILGSKDSLIQAIRLGLPVRVGWGWQMKGKSMEHISDPIWMVVLNEQEVMVHLDPQVLSKVEWDSLEVSYTNFDQLAHEWRVVLTIQGTFDAIWYDLEQHELVRHLPQQHIMSWFVQYPHNQDIINSPPRMFDKD